MPLSGSLSRVPGRSPRLTFVCRSHWEPEMLTRKLLLFACVTLSFAAHGQAPPSKVTTDLVGTFNHAEENGCIYVARFVYRIDCSYDNAQARISGRTIPWVGPTLGAVYYPHASAYALPAKAPVNGDDRRPPPMTATLTVDTHGTASGADDTVSGSLLIGPGLRSVTTRVSAQSHLARAVESWKSIRHSLAETTVNAATANAAGGFDYVIGAKGFPAPLCLKTDAKDCFPSAAAPLLTDGKWGVGVWAKPAAVPITASPALGGNVGTHTTASIEGYRCVDTSHGAECQRGVGLWGLKAGLDNLLLAIATDATGHIQSVSRVMQKPAA